MSEREGMNGLIADVSAFHLACGQPIEPQLLIPGERVDLRRRLIREEYTELMKEGFGVLRGHEVDLVSLADGLVDLIYVCVGTALEFGIPLDRVWLEVQRANMAKAGPDGKVRYRDDGKVLKPDGWQPPDVHAAIGLKR